MRVHLLSVVGKFVKMLPYMMEHYRKAGVRSFHIHVHATSEDDPVIGQVEAVLRRFGIAIAAVHYTPTWIDAQNLVVQETLWRHPNDWFIIVDQDELQSYPCNLFEMLAECEEEGYDHIHGCFVDRFGPDGTLPPIDTGAPVWEQFPYGSFLTHTLVQGYPRKIALTKGSVQNNGSGSHWASGGNPCPIERYHIPVHHFKWTDGLVEHLKERVGILKLIDNHWMESQRVIDYLEQNGGRIDIDDPNLFVAPCDPEYRKWPHVTRICSHSAATGMVPEVIWADRGGPIRINAGGVATGNYRGNLRGYRPHRHLTRSIDTRHVVDTAPVSLYEAARTGEFSYAFCGIEPSSRYLVRLHFAELEYEVTDARLFDIRINGMAYLQNFDVLRTAGGQYKAVVKQTEVLSDDLGCIFIDFFNELSKEPMVSGIEILDVCSAESRSSFAGSSDCIRLTAAPAAGVAG